MNVTNVLKRGACLVCVAVVVIFAPMLATAQPSQSPDVRLLVDISGSMKKNDPANLRQPSIELLVQLLPPNSRSGVWTFGQYTKELVPHGKADAAWKKNAVGKSDQINSVGLFTNIGLALEDAGLTNTGPNTNIILLTDGMVDIAKDPKKNEKEWRRIVDEVIPKLRKAGVRVHTIALSDKADSQLLNKLALATNGKAATAKTADELMKAFLATFDQAAPAEQVPLSDESFAIDSSVEEFTALIFRKEKITPTVLQGPDGNRYSLDMAEDDPEVSWFSGLDYDLITIKQPLEGEWLILTGIAPDSRVTVVSNLNLVVKIMPTNLFRGQRLPLDARLQEDGETVTAQDFLQLVDLTATTMGGNMGRQIENLGHQGAPADGIYRARLAHFDEPGEYEVTIALDGKSFQRQIKHSVTVRDAFAVDFGPGAQPGMPHELTVTPFIQTIDFEKTSVIALIKTPSGGTSILPIPATQVDDWLLKYSPEEEGIYTVNITIDVVETNGNGYEYKHPEFEFSYPEGEMIGAAEPVPPEPEPKAEPEPETDDQPEAEPEEESGGLPWWIYVALGVANILIFAIAFLVYRKFMGGKKDDGEEQLAKKKKGKEKKEAAKEEEPAPEPEEKPAEDPLAMADIDEGEELEEEPAQEQIDTTGDMDDASDLSDDEAQGEPEPDPEPEASEESDPTADGASEDLGEDLGLEDDEDFGLDKEPEPEPVQDLEETADEDDSALDDALDLADDDDLDQDPFQEPEETEIPEAPMDDLEAMLREATADLPDLDDEDEEFTLDDFDPDKDK